MQIAFAEKNLFQCNFGKLFYKICSNNDAENSLKQNLTLPPCAFLQELTTQKLIINQYKGKPNLLGNFLISELP